MYAQVVHVHAHVQKGLADELLDLEAGVESGEDYDLSAYTQKNAMATCDLCSLLRVDATAEMDVHVDIDVGDATADELDLDLNMNMNVGIAE